MFVKVTKSIHGQKAIEIQNANPAQHKFMRGLLGCPWTSDVRYQLRTACHAFFQCGSNEESGYILIEFWTHDDAAIQNFVRYVNEHMPPDIQESDDNDKV